MRLAGLLLLLCNGAAAHWLTAAVERGRRLEGERRWAEAEAVYEAALQDCASRGCAEERFWLETSAGEMSFNRGDYKRARRRLAAAEASLRTADRQDSRRLDLLNAKAALDLVEGRLTAAENTLRTAASLAEQLGASAALAGILHNLASIEVRTGRAEQASRHQERALELSIAEFGDRHESVLRAWISLSTIQGLRGDWKSAEHSLRRALAIAETQEALANYAMVLERLKRDGEARDIRRRIPATVTPAQSVIDAKAMPHERRGWRAVAR